jgi:AraC-like DNA-binding protein
VRDYIESNLAHRLTTEDLARVVNLSGSHFIRAFTRSFGSTVHYYVMQRRVAMAQRLMLGTSEQLSRIALSCGMSDQSHLTRWFRRVVGQTPAAWRRSRPHPV